MRDLEFSEPYKITATTVHFDHLQDIGPYNYSRGCCVVTKFGMVYLADLVWENNIRVDRFSVFTASIDGMVYTAWLDEGQLSDIRIKWMSTHFIKMILSGDWKNHPKKQKHETQTLLPV